MRRFSDEDRRRRLVARHRLGGDLRCDGVLDVVDSLLAVHSSDPATVFLSVAARLADASIERVEQSLHAQRSLVRHHTFRRTLWVMRPEIARAAHASATVKIAAVERRKLLTMVAASADLSVENLDGAERWCGDALDRVKGLLAEQGPTTTREIGRRFPELRVPLALGAGTKHAGHAAAHTKILQLAGFEAELIRTAPTHGWNTAEYAWAETSDWLGQKMEGGSIRPAAASILQSWLERFGPATETDIRWWTGWTVTQMKTALADIEAEPVSLEGGDSGWIASGDGAVDDVSPSIALLPGLDATTMGWKERRWYLSDEAATRTFDRWGNAGPTIWRNGQVVGGWVQREDGSVGTELFSDLTSQQQRQLAAEIDRFMQLVGETRVRVRFPAPNQKELLVSSS